MPFTYMQRLDWCFWVHQYNILAVPWPWYLFIFVLGSVVANLRHMIYGHIQFPYSWWRNMSCYLSKPVQCKLHQVITEPQSHITESSPPFTTIHHPPKTAQTQNCQTHTFSRFRTAARSDERCWLQEFAPWCLNSQVCNLHNALRLRFW